MIASSIHPVVNSLYTIGHSNHELPFFVSVLKRHGIAAVADVRSQPYSQRYPQFNREVLTNVFKVHGIEYVQFGTELGARRSEAGCYEGDRVSFRCVRETDLFREGLERLREALRKNCVTLLCAEKDPITCHRMILICRSLRGEGIPIFHILSDGGLETNEQAEERLLDITGLSEGSLFESREQLLERAYDIQGERIAFVGDEGGRYVQQGK